MKKQTKKLLTLLLALTLVLGLMPMAAGASVARFELSADDCTPIGSYMLDPEDEDYYLNAYLYDGEIPAGATSVVFTDYNAEDTTITSMTGSNYMLEETNAATLSKMLFAYTRSDADYDIEETESLILAAGYEDYPFESCLAYFVMDNDTMEWTVYYVIFEPVNTDTDRSFTVSVGNYVIPAEDIELVEGGYTSDNPYVPGPLPADLYVVTVPADTESVLFTFERNRLAYNYDGSGNWLAGYYADYQTGDTTAERYVDYGSDYAPADGEFDYILVQTPYDEADNSFLLYAVTFCYAEDDAFRLSADDCTPIGSYMLDPEDEDYYLNAYLYDGEIPAGATKVVFTDYNAEDTTITSMTGSNYMLEETNAATLSKMLFAYTRSDADYDIEEMESLILAAGYEDYPFESCLAYFVMDNDTMEWAVYYVIFEPVNTDTDRTFSVSVGNYVIPAEDIELVEGGYTSDNPYAPGPLPADLYVVTIPADTESVLFTFERNRIVYNYDGSGNWLAGYYVDYQTGDTTAERYVDYGSDYAPADGEFDYILVQTPYDEADNSFLLYAVTFVYAEELTIIEEPEDYSGEIGETATFSVLADGAGLTYQWYVKNATASKFSKSSVKTPEYSIEITAKNAGRQLYCVVKDKYGNTARTETVTIIAEGYPVIFNTLEDFSGPKGSIATFAVEADGEGLTYQWYVKNATATKFTKSSITEAVYSTQITSKNDGRQLYCVVKDQYGHTAKTETVTMYAEESPVIFNSLEDYYGPQGSTAILTVEAEGEGLTYQWYVKKASATKFSKSSITDPTYTVTLTSARNGNQVYCVVKDAYGNTAKTETVTLNVEESPVITNSLEDYVGGLNSTVTFTVEAEGEGLTYQWYVKKASATKFSKSSITDPTYTVTLTSARDGNQVYCVVTDQYGNTAKTETVTMSIGD